MKLVAGLLMLLVAGISAAETGAPPRQELGVWGDVSLHTTSMGGLTAEDVRGRRLLLAGVRYQRVLTAGAHTTFSYAIDFIPAAVAFSSQTAAKSDGPSVARQDVFGWGASPLGLLLHFGSSKMQPFLSFTGGFLHFQEPVPSPAGTRWNFTACAGGGVRIPLSPHRALYIGTMLHHLSNGRERTRNPSLNTWVLHLGITLH